ncbi:Metallo-hydrolase/oxidoreductase [Periconia macrospinosa]|uniref:Metallo-hydrolase/oxidoreductase n=1 Tax=Periconia macrospinosa TaxID=97972 RepID=A0A2V1DRY8_9PLEO|nr:Metallo-hydrolase/oxidoreductase [Periconia macrospinosa]
MMILLSLWLLFALARAQNITTNFAEWFNVTTFPKEQWKNVSKLLSEAQEIASPEVFPDFMHRCILVQAYPELGDATSNPGWVTPASPFRDVFFVGQSAWSSWAIDTGNRELLLIDTLATPEEAEKVIIPGLESFGYSGRDVKSIVITHEHTDHFGGLAYFQKHFNPYVYASETTWVAMANSNFNPPEYYNYSKARTLDDGETLDMNGLQMQAYHTPGHTPGCISLTFPVVDKLTQESHRVGLYGGGGIPRSAAAMVQQVNSWTRWSELSRAVGVDVLMSNHQTQDHSLWNLDLLRHRDCEGTQCNIPNPYVIGTDAYVRYSKVMSLCVQVQAARSGVSLSGEGFSKRDAVDENCHG